MPDIDVWSVTPASSKGWGPVTELATLAARVFGTQARFIHPSKQYGRVRKAFSLMPRRRGGGRHLLAIVAHPGDMLALNQFRLLRGDYDQVGVWIVDSFWDERIPLFARHRTFGVDHLWITDAELVDHYSAVTGVRTTCLPWGTDALTITAAPRKVPDVDLLRLGRQPGSWDDDLLNGSELATAGLTYRGRFPADDDGVANQRLVVAELLRAKVALVCANTSMPGDYGHPTRDYLSARFTDAAAAGCRIAGVRPACAAADLIPSGAWLDLPISDRRNSIELIRSAAQDYDLVAGRRRQGAALRALDWRHRLAQIGETFDVMTDTLRAELEQVEARARTFTTEPPLPPVPSPEKGDLA